MGTWSTTAPSIVGSWTSLGQSEPMWRYWTSGGYDYGYGIYSVNYIARTPRNELAIKITLWSYAAYQSQGGGTSGHLEVTSNFSCTDEYGVIQKKSITHQTGIRWYEAGTAYFILPDLPIPEKITCGVINNGGQATTVSTSTYPTPVSGRLYYNINGSWKPASIHYSSNGTWKSAILFDTKHLPSTTT